MSIFLFLVYALGFIRIFISDIFLNSLLWKLSYVSFLLGTVSLISGLGYIMNFSKSFNYFLLLFSIVFLVGIFTSNNYLIVDEEIRFKNSVFLDVLFVMDIIFLIFTLIVFLIFGFKKNNVHAKLFSMGGLLIVAASFLNIMVINSFYKYLSVPGIFLIIYSFIIRADKKKI
jgi:sterol desaturase/sphingolipid hydroxylase (fatty acid hydroxylase superfamily)